MLPFKLVEFFLMVMEKGAGHDRGIPRLIESSGPVFAGNRRVDGFQKQATQARFQPDSWLKVYPMVRETARSTHPRWPVSMETDHAVIVRSCRKRRKRPVLIGHMQAERASLSVIQLLNAITFDEVESLVNWFMQIGQVGRNG